MMTDKKSSQILREGNGVDNAKAMEFATPEQRQKHSERVLETGNGYDNALAFAVKHKKKLYLIASIFMVLFASLLPAVTVYVVQLFGLFGVVSGAIMFAKVGRNPDLLGPSLVRMGVGSMAVNFITFLKMIGVSFVGVVNTTINNII